MTSLTDYTIEQLEAEIERRKSEPDLSEVLEVFKQAYIECPDLDRTGSWRAGLIAAYPHLRKAMGDDPQDDGWIEWGGGECPVPGDTQVEVMLRSGACLRNQPAKWLDWKKSGHSSDIIAYRIIKDTDNG